MGRPKKEEKEEVKDTAKNTIKKVVNEINREKGSEAIKMANTVVVKERIPLPTKELNDLLHGGIPYGQFSVIWGSKSNGKTTLVYNIIAEAQKTKKKCLYMDFERSFDPKWAEKQGVKLDELLIGSFQTAEEGFEVLRKMATEQVIDLIVIDSIQGLSPQGEQVTKTGADKGLSDETMALLARKLSLFFRVCSGNVAKNNVAVLLIGQARTALGGFVTFDSLSGGHALHHWACLIIKMRRGQKVDAPYEKFTDKDGKKMKRRMGFDTVISIEKTKIDSETESSEIHIPFYFKTGFIKPEGVVETKEVVEEIENEEEITEEK